MPHPTPLIPTHTVPRSLSFSHIEKARLVVLICTDISERAHGVGRREATHWVFSHLLQDTDTRELITAPYTETMVQIEAI